MLYSYQRYHTDIRSQRSRSDSIYFDILVVERSGVPRNFFSGGGSTNSVEDRGQRGRGSGGGSPLVRGSGGSCNLVQEISFHIVKFF